MAGRRKVLFSAALASLQSLDAWNTKGVNVSCIVITLVLASRSGYFWKSEQFHFILAINVLFRDLDLNLAAPGEILIYLLAAYVACRETKLEGCADSIKANTCYRHGPSISSLTTQLRLHYIDSDPFKQKVSVLLDTLRAFRTAQQHYGMAALVLNVVIATRTHGHGHVSTHVRWLYSL